MGVTAATGSNTGLRAHGRVAVAVLVLVAGIALGAWLLLVEDVRSGAGLLEALGVDEGDPELSTARLAAVFAGAVLLYVAMLPYPLVLAAAGLLLGVWAGLVVGLGALGCAATVHRAVGTEIAGRRLRRRLENRHPDLHRRLERAGGPGVIAVRLFGAPTPAIAWATSAAGIGALALAGGVIVGTIPRGIAYVTLGANGGSLWPPSEWTWPVIGSLLVIGIASAATLVVSLRLHRSGRATGDS